MFMALSLMKEIFVSYSYDIFTNEFNMISLCQLSDSSKMHSSKYDTMAMDRVIEREVNSKQSERGAIQVMTQENVSRHSEATEQVIREQTIEEQKSNGQ